jgi:endophilin-B
MKYEKIDRKKGGAGKEFAQFVKVGYNRARQVTGEKLGTVQRTDYDREFQDLCNRVDKHAFWASMLTSKVELVLQPNPAYRFEDFVTEKFGNEREIRHTYTEQLGICMLNAGSDMSSSDYGQALLIMGDYENRIGESEHRMMKEAYVKFVKPFMDAAAKEGAINTERRTLTALRLDLDAAKNRVRAAKTADEMKELEQFVDEAQKKFDEQYELVREMLEERDLENAAMVVHLEDLCSVQVEYFKAAHELAVEMEKKVLNRPTKGKDMRKRKDSSSDEE